MTRRTTRRAFLSATLGTGVGLLVACAPPSAPQAPSKPAEPAKPAAAPPTAAPAKPAEAPKPAEAAKPAATAAPAAAPAKPDAKPAAGGVFNYAEAGDFNDFNPWTYTAVNNEMYNQVFSRLTWKGGDGKPNPDIAESWQMAPDNLSLKLKLRENVKWHDGKDLTSQDFVTMWGYRNEEALAKHTGVAKIKGITAPIKDLVAPDKYTVELRFDAPVPFVFDILDWFYAIRIDDMADPSFLKKLPIGTGPFTANEWVANQYARFAKNPNYYNRELPRLNEMVFKRLTQAETLVPNLKSGSVDGILMSSLADAGPLQGDPNYQLEVNENSGSFYNIQVNALKPPLDKKEVRQALSYSLNRVEMAKTAFFGVSQPISTAFFGKTSLAYRDDLVMPHQFDLDKARKLLDTAGVKNLDLNIIVTPAWPQMKLFSLVWQADLNKIGVKLRVDEVENAKFYEINTHKDMQGNDLEAWLNARVWRDPAIFWSTQRNYRAGTVGTFGFVQEELEQLVAQGATEPDQAKRTAIYQKLNEILLDECHVIQVATNPRVYAFNKSVQGMRVDLNGNLVMDQVSMAR